MAAFRNDPVRGYNFLVSFVDSSSDPDAAPTVSGIARAALGGFSEASGLEMALEIEEYKEGGRNDGLRLFPTRITWPHLRLKRGIAHSDDLWQWHYRFVEGRGVRRDGIVALHNDLHQPVRVWQFRRGLPVKWTGPALNAGQSEVAVEELEIAHEGLKLIESQTLMGIGELASSVAAVGGAIATGFSDAADAAGDLFGG